MREPDELWELLHALDNRINALLENMKGSQEQVTRLFQQRRKLMAELASTYAARARSQRGGDGELARPL